MTASPGVLAWWTALSLVGLFNIGLWLIAAASVAADAKTEALGVRAFRRTQLLLSAGFVFGCAFRSFLPRADVQRICLVDSWWSTVFVGRSVATVAELCFMAQAALTLRELARSAGAADGLSARISRLIVPFIAVAETCSWYAVLTTDYIGNALEESIWTLSAALLFVGLVALFPRWGAKQRRAMLAPLVFIAGYVAFMVAVDVPMYLSRWSADQAASRAYLDLSQGLQDVTHRWVLTRRWEDWSTEIPWMTLYFSAAVWLSLALTRAPRKTS